MATSLVWKSGVSLLRRSLTVASVRCAGGPPAKQIDHHKGKVPSDDVTMPDSIAHAVGIDRQELLAREAGDDDPFQMKVIKRAKGSFEEPTVITSPNRSRMVGCICEEDALTINWMNLHKEEPKRCECGYWFKLVDAPGGGHH
ncbi:hypothetical protein EGW08_008890 [Elysia chlorotica]|uniref:Cytochrome c oxidase subunit 5B, mitochondrial n=1 Tax=Elysia chlorotica TaxID=188477 RepID=A0A3S1HP37_ELYCH|nr:hypothetical protein EGW08_008890 [Elysia chlorotica]